MIISRISGGLGNQLFQYAFTRALGLKFNQKFMLDISWYSDIPRIENPNDPNATTIREYLLNNFKTREKFVRNNFINWTKRLESWSSKSPILNLLKKWPLRFLSYTNINHDNFSYDAFSVAQNVYLSGYWQKSDIIEKYSDVIRSEFVLANPVSQDNKKYLEAIQTSNSVAIHFRRNDYICKPDVHKRHSMCSNEYYQNGIEIIKTKISDPKYFIFSDEIDWVKNNFKSPEATVFIDSEGSDVEHFYLMSQCNNIITANSTYSWWAAWLNSNPEKTVITPQTWYNNPELNKSTIRIPEDWIQLENTN